MLGLPVVTGDAREPLEVVIEEFPEPLRQTTRILFDLLEVRINLGAVEEHVQKDHDKPGSEEQSDNCASLEVIADQLHFLLRQHQRVKNAQMSPLELG